MKVIFLVHLSFFVMLLVYIAHLIFVLYDLDIFYVCMFLTRMACIFVSVGILVTL